MALILRATLQCASSSTLVAVAVTKIAFTALILGNREGLWPAIIKVYP